MKKIVSILISISFMLMSVPAFAISGSGTETNPYLISSASDIARIHDDLDGYYKLTANIDMSGVDFIPIGNEDEGAFTGTIDGNGHTISNLNINLPDNKYVGFVGYLEGTVKNLNLDNVDACGCRYVGGLVGYSEEGSEIYNCSIVGCIGGEYRIIDLSTGGIVGYSNGIISNCQNYAKLNTDGAGEAYCSLGGVCGYSSSVIQHCDNYGELSAGTSGILSIGGICGYSSSVIQYCDNYGELSAGTSGILSIGGICGESTGIISGSINYGNIISDTSEAYAGGISGIGNIIRNCNNFATIKNQGYGSTTSGITNGEFYSSEISMCCNYGDIYGGYGWSSLFSGASSWACGIASVQNVSNCINYGNIIMNGDYRTYAGGITSDAVLSSCANYGNITAGYYGTQYDENSININPIGVIFSGRKIIKMRYDEDDFNDLDETWFIDPNTNSGFPQLRNMPRHIVLNECVEVFEVGDHDRLYASIDGKSESVTWSCDDTSIAMVSSNGTVTAKAIGTCTVTATNSEGMKANCLIYVYVRANAMELSNNELNINENETYILSPVESPNTANENVVWYSEDESIATVDQNGTVTAKSKGTTTVYAVTAQSNIRANCTVHVSAPITSISLSTTYKSLKLGDSDVITATISPSDYEGGITWDSSDNDIVSVNQKGKITANKIGTAYITATASSGVTEQCIVTVTQPSTSIKLNKSEITTYEGSTYQLSATLLPFDTTDTVTWTTSYNYFASVSDTGLVTGQIEGTEIITATTTSGLTATCYVTVKAAKIDPISLSLADTYVTLAPDDAKALTATILPSNTTETQLTWTSSNENVAIVNQIGVVTAVSNGFATIKAKTSNGLSAECVVKVVSATGTSVILSNAKASPNGTAQVKASVVKNPGISGYKFTVDYDDTLLTPVSVEANPEFGGTLTTNLDDANRTEFNILWYADNDIDINGDLFTINFEVKDNAAYGDSSEISLNYGAKDICNVNGDSIALYIQNATVNIAGPLPGDVYEDDEVTVFDLTLLARYITGLETFTDRQLEAADVNNDNEVDIKDVVTLAQYIVGWSNIQLLMSLRSFGAESANITVGTASVNEALEAEIPVYITNNPGVAGFRYVIEHAEDLEVLSITPTMDTIKDKFQTNLGQQGDNDLIVSWYNTDNMTENGELFKIKVRLTNPDADISQISIKPADNNMCNENKQNVIAEYTDGYVMNSNYIITNEIITDTAFNCELYFDNTFEEQTASAILAFYDEQGKLVQVKFKDITIKPGKVDLNFDIENKPYSTYKLMLWEGMHSMRPLVDVR